MTPPHRILPTGKKPAQPARPQLRARGFLDTNLLPDPPEQVDNFSRVPSWPMYGNDEWGDCVFAGIGHHEQQISLYGQGAEVRVTNSDVLGGYSQVTGFNPSDPSTDQGTYVQDAMGWWRRAGIAGHQIVAYASVDPSDLRLIRQCINLFGAVGVGFNFPRSAMAQFNTGQSWDVVAGSPIDGGHYVIAGAYGPDWWDNITWARRQRMTTRFWAKYVDEVWLVIDDEMADKLTGRSGFAGVDLYALGQDFAALTREPNPIPVPPAPVPVDPAPEAKDPRDVGLERATREWRNARHSGANRRAARAVSDWVEARDLP